MKKTNVRQQFAQNHNCVFCHESLRNTPDGQELNVIVTFAESNDVIEACVHENGGIHYEQTLWAPEQRRIHAQLEAALICLYNEVRDEQQERDELEKVENSWQQQQRNIQHSEYTRV